MSNADKPLGRNPAIDYHLMFEQWLTGFYGHAHGFDLTRSEGLMGYEDVDTNRQFFAHKGAAEVFMVYLNGDRAQALDDAIHAMTDTLEYEWTGDFREAIEKLNSAYMRFSVHEQRIAPRIMPHRRADVEPAGPHTCVPWRGRGGPIGKCVHCGRPMA